MSTESFATFMQSYYGTELGRITATIVAITFGLLLNRLWGRYLLRTSEGRTAARMREKLVFVKNLVWVGVAVVVITIWASKIAGIILSLAAVAGATLIVSKELLMCLLGYGMLTATRSYRVGDFIEIAGMRGRVIDIHVFATTLAETGSAHQVTGKSLSMPNSVVLSQAVRNLSATGHYIVDILSLVLPVDVDMDLAEQAALTAAHEVTGEWQAAADAHFERIEGLEFLDLPSSRPKVLWQSLDGKSHTLSIRFGCPMLQRVNAEQDIFRRFWKLYREAMAQKNAPTQLGTAPESALPGAGTAAALSA